MLILQLCLENLGLSLYITFWGYFPPKIILLIALQKCMDLVYEGHDGGLH